GELEDLAAARQTSFYTLSITAPAANIEIPAPVLDDSRTPADKTWIKAVKAAYERELEAGGLITYAETSELPAAARRQLELELQTLPQGPGNTSEAFKMMVNGQAAFVIQSYIYDDNLRVYIFNTAGARIAYGEGSVDKDFVWSDGVSGVKARAVQSWSEAAKAAYERELEAGGLTTFADLLELPPGARRQLDLELQTLPQGPGNTSEAFKMMVNGRTAFVVQSYIYSDNLRVHIFNAAGVRVAYGEGSVDKDFAWLPLPAPKP
ncbi:MAG: hypothetical protein WCK76_14890, partial [Elusimicrobiota bacterium]